jgi:hypothetical protein
LRDHAGLSDLGAAEFPPGDGEAFDEHGFGLAGGGVGVDEGGAEGVVGVGVLAGDDGLAGGESVFEGVKFAGLDAGGSPGAGGVLRVCAVGVDLSVGRLFKNPSF